MHTFLGCSQDYMRKVGIETSDLCYEIAALEVWASESQPFSLLFRPGRQH
jgi:hypothetical protein